VQQQVLQQVQQQVLQQVGTSKSHCWWYDLVYDDPITLAPFCCIMTARNSNPRLLILSIQMHQVSKLAKTWAR
jgi:hypothetical protein